MNNLILVQSKVIRRGKKDWKSLYLCLCGKEFLACVGDVKRGDTTSCGCHRRKINTKHGYSNSRTYKSWDSMKQRCLNSNSLNYSRYGGRGITIDPKWVLSFEEFLKDMGPRPENTSIDRIDNNKGYSKDNCRWATPVEQAKNKRPKAEWKKAA